MMISWKRYSYSNMPEAIGYRNIANGLRGCLESSGVPLIDVDMLNDGAHTICIHCAPPHRFEPKPGHFNLLYTMWETESIPPALRNRVAQADLTVVPSQYCARIWEFHDLPTPKVICPGLHPIFFKVATDRPIIFSPVNPSPIRFLFIGARSPRKGWDVLCRAWQEAFLVTDPVVLYIKTGGVEQKVDVRYGGKFIVDTRYLEMIDLARLYASSHVFVFPSYGEGFGYPALEAMACGCLTIATPDTGLTEFVRSSTGIPINRSIIGMLEYGTDKGAIPVKKPLHTPHDVAMAMRLAFEKWGTPPLEARRNHGTKVARSYTWEATREKFIGLLKEVIKEAA